MTLDQWAERFKCIYGINNVTYFTSLGEKIGLLMVQSRALQDAIRKEAPKDKLERVLAHVFAWTYAVVNHCEFASIASFMSEKYPLNGCGYCGLCPCRCDSTNRPDHEVYSANAEQVGWDVTSWQRHIYSNYGRRNRMKGIHDCLNRLFAELAEVTLILTGGISGYPARDIHHQYGLELADVFAWIFAISDVLDIELSDIISSMYAEGCPCCEVIPCDCPKFTVVDGKICHAQHILIT